MQRTLLLVDDDPIIIESLSLLLQNDGYKIYTANNAAEALEILKTADINVIVSDQHMPNMNGTEFLKQVRSTNPEIIRIILSGLSELEDVLIAINEGAIYKFFIKPWNSELLRYHILDAFLHQEMLAAKDKIGELFNSSLDGIVIFNADGIIQSINPTFTQITGFTKDDLINKSFKMMTVDGTTMLLHELLASHLDVNTRWESELWTKKKNGNNLPINITLETIFDDMLKIKYYAAIIQNKSVGDATAVTNEHTAKDEDSDLPIDPHEIDAALIGFKDAFMVADTPHDWLGHDDK